MFTGLLIFFAVSVLFTYWDRFGGTSLSRSIFALICDHINLISIITVTCLYVHGYMRIHNYSNHSPIYRSENGEVSRPEYVHKLCKTVFILVMSYNITRSPIYIGNITHSLYKAFDRTIPPELHEFMQFTFILVFANCCVNSLVVFRLNSKVKNWIMKNICRCWKRARQEEEECQS